MKNMKCKSTENTTTRKRADHPSPVFLAVTALITGLLLAGLFYWLANSLLPLDLSQEYRKINGYESIIFRRSWDDRCYTRCFWGLKSTEAPPETPWENMDEEEAREELLRLLPEAPENEIWQAVYAPDRHSIVYCEIQYDHTHSGVTDDEYCYYKVFDKDSGAVITLYQGYREWYDLFWASHPAVPPPSCRIVTSSWL